MNTRKYLNFVLSTLIMASMLFGGFSQVTAQSQNSPNGNGKGNGKGHGNGQMRSMTQAERKAARLNQPKQQTGVSLNFAGLDSATAAFSPLAAGLPTNAVMAAPNSIPDYFGVGNWANSPLPTVDLAGNITGGMRKFIDPLPGLCNPGSPVGPVPACDPAVKSIPLAAPTKFSATTIAPASDYYEIALIQYHELMSSDLPAPGTLLRGYVQLVPSGTPGAIDLSLASSGADPLLPGYFAAAMPSYLGPIILATGCEPTSTACQAAPPTPVRVKFTNLLPGMEGEPLHPHRHHLHGGRDGPDRAVLLARTAPPCTCMAAIRPGSATGRLTSGPCQRETPLLPIQGATASPSSPTCGLTPPGT